MVDLAGPDASTIFVPLIGGCNATEFLSPAHIATYLLKTVDIAFSVSPTYLLYNSDPLTAMNPKPASLAMA